MRLAHRSKTTALIGATVAVALTLTACSDDGGDDGAASTTSAATSAAATTAAADTSAAAGTSAAETTAAATSAAAETSAAPAASGEKITLTIGLFGTINEVQQPLYDEYMKAHPNITIKTNVIADGGDAFKSYQTKWAAGGQIEDLIAIEGGWVGRLLRDNVDKFVDMNTIDNAAEVKATFHDWKWASATSADGKTIGLGTDIGPEAFCYRSDMFKAAGLPDDPAELATKLKTWDDLIAMGKQYMASPTKPKGSAFIDGPSTIFNSEVYQHEVAYSDPTGKAVPETSDGVKAAWDNAVEAAQAGITAKFQPFNGEWGNGFAKSTFAAISCPSWMLGYIEGQAKEAGKGKWNITSLPGGATNWGGSWMGVSATSKHVKEATDLAVFLTNPESQVKIWVDAAQFPSSKKALEDPAVKGAKAEYFQNAPIGEIFAPVAEQMKITAPGPFDGDMSGAFIEALASIETQNVKPEDAWKKALADIKEATG